MYQYFGGTILNYRGADKSLARPGRKQATAKEDFDFHIPYLKHNWTNISTIYIYNKISIKRNILTIKQNISGSKSGYGLIIIPVEWRQQVLPNPRYILTELQAHTSLKI